MTERSRRDWTRSLLRAGPAPFFFLGLTAWAYAAALTVTDGDFVYPDRVESLVAAALALAALAWAPAPGSLDDAFVVWADARSWASGSAPSVEGSTSALDVALKARVLAVAGPEVDPLRVAGILGIAFLIAAVTAASFAYVLKLAQPFLPKNLIALPNDFLNLGTTPRVSTL